MIELTIMSGSGRRRCSASSALRLSRSYSNNEGLATPIVGLFRLHGVFLDKRNSDTGMSCACLCVLWEDGRLFQSGRHVCTMLKTGRKRATVLFIQAKSSIVVEKYVTNFIALFNIYDTRFCTRGSCAQRSRLAFENGRGYPREIGLTNFVPLQSTAVMTLLVDRTESHGASADDSVN